MPLLGAANLSLNKAHDRGRQCNSKARADICKQLLARASLDYSPNPPGGWDLARSRVFSQEAAPNKTGRRATGRETLPRTRNHEYLRSMPCDNHVTRLD